MRVEFGMGLSNSDRGMSGNESASSVKEADGEEEGTSQIHRNPLLHLGHFHHSILKLLCSLASFRSITAVHLGLLAADKENVSVFVRVGGALTGVPASADFDVSIRQIWLSMLRG